VEKGCQGNKYTTYKLDKPTDKITIKGGVYWEANLFNSTTDTYALYLEDFYQFDVKSSTRAWFNYVKQGAHVVKAVQITNISGTAIQKSFRFTIACDKDVDLRLN